MVLPPLIVIVALLGLTRGRRRLAGKPLLAFTFISCLFAAALFAGWGLY